MGLSLLVIRYGKSYDFKRNPKAPDDWDNNDQNNMLDKISLWLDEAMLLEVRAQTVSNIPGGRFLDTVAPGPFNLSCFVANRAFYGEIHGICDTFDIERQAINGKSIQSVMGKDGAPIDYNRTLMHDTQKCKPNPPMTLTRVAWSAGCFVTMPSDLEAFNQILHAYKVQPGDMILGELREV